jgi:hypothetical protein
MFTGDGTGPIRKCPNKDSEFPATYGHPIAKQMLCTQVWYKACTDNIQPIYSSCTAFNFPLEICFNLHSFELFTCVTPGTPGTP